MKFAFLNFQGLQGGFPNVTELPLLFFPQRVKKQGGFLLRLPDSTASPIFTWILSPSLLISLPSSILIPLPAGSSQGGDLSWKVTRVGEFHKFL